MGLKLDRFSISGKEVLPIIEGGKGINISTGLTAGSFAKAGAVGTISGTNPDFYDENGKYIPYSFNPKATRKEKHDALVEQSIRGCIAQAKIAHDVSAGNGRIHFNFLWEAGGTKIIMEEALSKTVGLIHGITSGAGLPYALSDIAGKYNIYYYPIVSSSRAFSILWKRSYSKTAHLLGGVVYEDPWLAGGHNGLSNQEDPKVMQDPYLRIVAIRKVMNELNLSHVPIIIAGGVWNLTDWSKYFNNDEVGLVAFQFGTRPLLTKESPISDSWKQKLLTLKEGDVSLNKFSPTGFYSSAVNNLFLQELYARSERQMMASRKQNEEFSCEIIASNGITKFYVKSADYDRALAYIKDGFDTFLRTPEDTIIFETQNTAELIKEDQQNCMGCLSGCRFSNWSENEKNNTGLLPDPRSFCIEKTLQDVGHNGSIDNNLLFSGHHAYRFATDPLYKNNHIPTIAELVEKISIGE
ncbi:MAG: nitronate monooxygenase [Alphaproteobacteria bacterium]|jgi:NAD(P)H-dependent flavin oxidoreductase YrpB (nitropropane dioxygenase family)|nr:nitronate monooxygenase [Alphaproteobacteria bacterium]